MKWRPLSGTFPAFPLTGKNYSMKLRRVISSLKIFAFLLIAGVTSTSRAAVLSEPFNPEPSPTPTSAVELPWGISGIVKSEFRHCMTDTAPTNDELRRNILAFGSRETSSENMSGILFTDEKSNTLEAFKKLIRDKNGLIVSSAVNSLHAPVNGRLTVLEAVTQVFGEREGLQILYLFLRYRINASHFQKDDTVAWTADQLDSLLLGLSDLPRHLVPFPLYPYAKYIGYEPAVHYKHGVKIGTAEGGYVLADSAMTFYDSWDEQDAVTKRWAVLHEIGHNLQNIITDRQNWTNLSPWPAEIKTSSMVDGVNVDKVEKFTTTYAKDYAEPFVSKYGKSSPSEDFAESVTAYRYRPDWLKERNLEKYNYLKEVIFDGIEYLDESSCRDTRPVNLVRDSVIRRNFVDFQGSLLDEAARRRLDPSLAGASPTCTTEYFSILGRSSIDDANSTLADCIGRRYVNWFNERHPTPTVSYPNDYLDLRTADASHGYYAPELTPSTKVRLGELSRASLRQSILQDFNAYRATNAAALKVCSSFGSSFTNWIKAQGSRSALLSTNGWNSSADLRSLSPILTKSCDGGMATRPLYIQLWERVRTAAPLTSAEFRTGFLGTVGQN